jgi:hypothetical protein
VPACPVDAPFLLKVRWLLEALFHPFCSCLNGSSLGGTPLLLDRLPLLLLSCSEAATGSDEAFGRRLLFRRSELLGRPTLSFPLYQAFDVELHTSCTFTDGCFRHWVLLLLPSYTGWSLLFLALASLIYLPEEPAGAAVRAPSALDVPADWLDTFQSLVNSAYHSVFTFLVRVETSERIYS